MYSRKKRATKYKTLAVRLTKVSKGIGYKNIAGKYVHHASIFGQYFKTMAMISLKGFACSTSKNRKK